MNLPDRYVQVDHACPSCASVAGTFAVIDRDGTPLWFRCMPCGLAWNADAPQQASLLSELAAR